jgi:plasmid stabilization system protein ParE
MRKVILSKRASSKLEKLLEYLEIEWSENVKQNFIRKLDTTLEIIKKYPESSEQIRNQKRAFSLRNY